MNANTDLHISLCKEYSLIHVLLNEMLDYSTDLLFKDAVAKTKNCLTNDFPELSVFLNGLQNKIAISALMISVFAQSRTDDSASALASLATKRLYNARIKLLKNKNKLAEVLSSEFLLSSEQLINHIAFIIDVFEDFI